MPAARRAGTATRFMELFLEFVVQQWILVAALVAVAGLLVFHESRKSGPSLSPQEAINLVNNKDGLFLDMREAKDFKKGHIVDALNIPFARLTARIGELEKHRERPIVLVCKMGQHSGAAARQLQQQGFEQVYKMRGGMMEWQSQQLPVVK